MKENNKQNIIYTYIFLVVISISILFVSSKIENIRISTLN